MRGGGSWLSLLLVAGAAVVAPEASGSAPTSSVDATPSRKAERARDKQEAALRDEALALDGTARALLTSRDPDRAVAVDAALEAFAAYVEAFGQHANADEVHYRYGEMLYRSGRYAEAYEAYMAVFSLDPQGPHAQFCLESAISAAEQLVIKGSGAYFHPSTGEPVKHPSPEAPTLWEQRVVDACDLYASRYVDAPAAESARYKAAYLLYSRGHDDEAKLRFHEIVAAKPSSRNAEFAANLILEMLGRHDDWACQRRVAEAFLATDALGSPEFKEQLREIAAAAADR